MLTIDEAILIARNNINLDNFDEVIDLRELYIFCPGLINGETALASMYSINKITGEFLPFRPFSVSPEEFKNAKRIKL